MNNGVETLVASGVKAMTGTDGGSLVTLDKSVEGDAIKVVITSWQGSAWACVADISAKEGEAPARDPYDVNGDGMVSIADVSTLLDYLSGAIHMIDAILTAFSIAVGVGAVITLYQLVTGGALLR